MYFSHAPSSADGARDTRCYHFLTNRDARVRVKVCELTVSVCETTADDLMNDPIDESCVKATNLIHRSGDVFPFGLLMYRQLQHCNSVI